jgi:hypothetical protein
MVDQLYTLTLLLLFTTVLPKVHRIAAEQQKRIKQVFTKINESNNHDASSRHHHLIDKFTLFTAEASGNKQHKPQRG